MPAQRPAQRTDPLLVSIVMPSYQNAHLISKAIDSVRGQSWQNWELIVVDNHSDDGTQKLVEAYADRRISFELIHNEGIIARSRNRGVELARGEWIAFLDSDDWWMPTKLQTALDAAETVKADLTYHDLFLVTRPQQSRFFRRVKGRALGDETFDALLENGNVLANSSVMIKRSVLNEIGSLAEGAEMLAWEDFDLWLRAAARGYGFHYIPQVLGYYWAAGGNTSNPKRTLLTLDAMIAHYFQPTGREVPFWVVFAQGMAHLHLKNYSDARAKIRAAQRKSTGIRASLKCWAARLYLGLRNGG